MFRNVEQLSLQNQGKSAEKCLRSFKAGKFLVYANVYWLGFLGFTRNW